MQPIHERAVDDALDLAGHRRRQRPEPLLGRVRPRQETRELSAIALAQSRTRPLQRGHHALVLDRLEHGGAGGQTEHRTELEDRVLNARRLAGFRVRHGGHPERRGCGVGEGSAHPEGDEAEDDQRVTRLLGEQREDQAAEHAEAHTAEDLHPLTDPRADLAGDRRPDDERQREAQVENARLQRAEVAHVLEIEREEEHEDAPHPVPAEVDEQRAHEDAVPEQRELDQWRPHARLEHEEQRDRRQARQHADDHERRAPATLATRLHAEHNQHQSHGQHHEAAQIEAARRRLVAAFLDDVQGHENCGDAEGHVHEEEPAPAELFREHAADERPQRLADRAGRRPDADRLAAVGRREGVAHDRERGDEAERGSQALERTGGDQPADRLRGAGRDRAGDERDQPEQDHPAAAERIGQAAGGDLRSREGEEERVEDPRERRGGRVERVPDGGQGDGEAERVDSEHEERHRHRGHDEPAAAAHPLGRDTRCGHAHRLSP